MTSSSNPKPLRLEARVSAEQKHLYKHAADIRGSTLSDFVINSLQEAAMRIIKEYEVIYLSIRDQEAFAEALLNPDKPNAQLLKAAKRHKKIIL